MNDEYIKKLNCYLLKLFQTKGLSVKGRPKKSDSAEVYINDEFIGIIYIDDENEDDISFSFQMSILENDL